MRQYTDKEREAAYHQFQTLSKCIGSLTAPQILDGDTLEDAATYKKRLALGTKTLALMDSLVDVMGGAVEAKEKPKPRWHTMYLGLEHEPDQWSSFTQAEKVAIILQEALKKRSLGRFKVEGATRDGCVVTLEGKRSDTREATAGAKAADGACVTTYTNTVEVTPVKLSIEVREIR